MDGKKESSSDFLIIFMVICVALAALYYFYGDIIRSIYLTIKLWELKLMNLIYPTETGMIIQKELLGRPIGNWSVGEVSMVGNYVGKRFNILYMLVVGVSAYLIYNKNPLRGLRRILTMQTLKNSESRLWPYITPVLDMDLVKESVFEGPYAMAMRPYDYCVKHNLLQNNKDTSSLNKQKLERLLTYQLGPLFRGVNKMKKHEKALIAIMAAHGNGDKKRAMKVVNALAVSARGDIKKMPDLSIAEELFEHLEHPDVKWVLERHAYVNTVIMEMMLYARKTGVFPSSFFVWVKPRDRTLFYMLNGVGRQVAYAEISGIFAHWLAEKSAKRKLILPYLENALTGMEMALSEVKLDLDKMEKKERRDSIKGKDKF